MTHDEAIGNREAPSAKIGRNVLSRGSARPLPVRTIDPRRPGIGAAFSELWRYRRFTLFFGRRILAKRYMRTWLGMLWLPLRPVIGLSTKILVFGGLVGITAVGVPYPLFFLLASSAWALFSECALWATRSIEGNRDVLRTFHVPRLVVIAAGIVPSLVEFLITISLAGMAVVWYLLRADVFYLQLTWWSPFCIAAALLLIVMLGVGIGLITASAAARARDVRFALTYGLSFAYFLTPVIYPFERIPDRYKPLAELNPVTGAIELFKLGLFPGEVVSPKAVAVTVTAVAVLWIPGVWLLQRGEVRDS